jgi:hypothetical protein
MLVCEDDWADRPPTSSSLYYTSDESITEYEPKPGELCEICAIKRADQLHALEALVAASDAEVAQ